MTLKFNPAQITVLVIEDDLNYLKQITSHLSELKYQLKVATNAQEAWNLITDANSPLDIIILDIVMPGKDGTWILDNLKKDPNYSQIPIIVLTNLSHGEKVGHAVVKGISRLLIKNNTSMKELSNTIREVHLSHEQHQPPL